MGKQVLKDLFFIIICKNYLLFKTHTKYRKRSYDLILFHAGGFIEAKKDHEYLILKEA